MTIVNQVLLFFCQNTILNSTVLVVKKITADSFESRLCGA